MSPGAKAPPSSGVFISKGMRVGVPQGGLTFTPNQEGGFDASIVLHTAVEMAPFWLEIALAHLASAEVARTNLPSAWQTQQNEKIEAMLEAEFRAGMQAIMAAGIALDAFYAAVKDHAAVPADVLKAWRENRTARHKQVSETFRRAFDVKAKGAELMQTAIKEVFGVRDIAVHPAQRLSAALRHPVIGVGTDWRYVTFAIENARPAVAHALSVISQLLTIPRPEHSTLGPYCSSILALVKPLVDQWESTYKTPLFERRPGQ